MNEIKLDIIIPKEIMLDYFKKLPNKIFKILPIYEGKDIYTNNINCDSITAYGNYQSYLDTFTIELSGASNIFPHTSKFIEILALIEGMKTIKEYEHKKVKKIVFKCINKCKLIYKEEVSRRLDDGI